MLGYIVTETSVSLNINGKPFVFAAKSPQGAQILAAIAHGATESELLTFCELNTAIRKWSNGQFRIEGDRAFYGDRELAPVLAKRLILCVEQNVPHGYLLNFIGRLMANPSARAVNELYPFLEYANLPITPEGFVLALTCSALTA